MASKKVKTVKELNVEVDQILVKIKVIEQNLQNVKDLLNSKMKEINSKLEVKTTQPENRSIKCKSCQNLFKTKTELTTHIYENHPKQLKCDMCEYACSEWYEMEKHMLAMHSVNKNFKCNRCEKSFVTEWRLKKHMQMHDKQTKFCHYFNNGKPCPYEDIGCMYKHALPGKCKSSVCENYLCQFEHEDAIDTIDNDEIVEEYSQINAEPDELSLNGNKCHLFMQQINFKDDLYDHMEQFHEAARTMQHVN